MERVMIWTTYKEKIKGLSERLVEIQRPIRILDAIKWDPSVETEFFANKGKKLPKVGEDYYKSIPLGFDPLKKDLELQELAQEIERVLGPEDELGHVLQKMTQQYRDVGVMLAHRGTHLFYEKSRLLYGSPKDRFFQNETTLMDQGRLLYDMLTGLENKSLGQEYPKEISSEEVVRALQERFSRSFLKDQIEVRLDDGIVADAAAGSDVIKIKRGAKFSKKDIDIFEVHEGWVHVATTLNGKAQKVATFLSKGPPGCAATQEGLAIMMEIFTFSSYPLRARAINDRTLGVDKAEDGADFLDIYKFYLTENYNETEAFRNAMRVFRGGCVTGKSPFTKDISYARGFIENYNFIRTAIQRGKPEIIPFIFAGKVQIDDVPLLYQRSMDGVIDAPSLLPPHFADLNGLAVWMSFSNFLNTLDMKKVTEYYDALFKKHL